MTLRDFLANWGLSKLKIKAGFLDAEFTPQDEDRLAAWDMYVELLTRVTTQPLAPDEGKEEAALSSLHAVFPITRDILKARGPNTIHFARIAVVVLNQILRPVTAKWHGMLGPDDRFATDADRAAFRADLEAVRPDLIRYTQALAALANVEDLTDLEAE